MKPTKKITLLHSNDLHGDFFTENIDGVEVGGVALLSGYVEKTRRTEKNVIYAIAGDMFRGSVIDEEYRGLSTIDIMNALSPDIATIGNHELDYGVSHLLFIEKCAEFPIINANLYVKNGRRLFTPSKVIEIDGMRVLMIGLITEAALAQTKQDGIIGAFIDVANAADEVGRVTSAYRNIDIDLTVLLTHIGIEADKKLARELLPELGVDIIIGGHSHTFMDAPEVENGILIAHAGTGSNIIGRFDIEVNTDTNTVSEWTWSSVPITENTAEPNLHLSELTKKYKAATDRKYERIVTQFKNEFTHPKRNMETELGNLFADVFRESLGLDIMLLGSGSIRSSTLGPVVEYGVLTEAFPFDDGIYMFRVTGEMFRGMMKYMLRDESFLGVTEFYQLSRGVKLVYSRSKHEFLEFSYNGKNIEDTDIFTVGMQTFHYTNIEKFLGVTFEEITKIQRPRVVAVSCLDVLDDYLSEHSVLEASVEGRIEIVD